MLEHDDDSQDLRKTLTVSELNRKVKSLLEIHFPLIWVEGEISNLSRPASGHWYFSLKDENAQIRCAMFKGRNATVTFKPAAGDHLKLRARVSLYEGRGDYQLIVEHMEQAGFGLLQKRYEELKARLLAEGLFDAEIKKTLPSQVRHLAVVTSPTGAAIRDVLSVLKRRFPSMPVTILPAPVQGDEAPPALIKQLRYADQCDDFDVILLCRGGGSLEDLWSFNSEALARAIHDCDKPVVSAVGHEVDFTIADFIADVRAPTPSAAAELLSADSAELLMRLKKDERRMQQCMSNLLISLSERLRFTVKALRHPRERIEQWHQRLDNLEVRMRSSINQNINGARILVNHLTESLHAHSPTKTVKHYSAALDKLSRQLQRATLLKVEQKRQHLQSLMAQLDLVSPIATLDRGYAIARDTKGKVIKHTQDVNVGDNFTLKVSDGELAASVTSKTNKQR